MTSESRKLELRRLHSVSDAAFAQLLEIYFEANEPGERKSPGQVASMIEEPAYYFLAGIESGVVAGFQILRVLDGVDAALLEYNAVERGRRNQGIGGELFRQVANSGVFAARFLLAEVGSDEQATSDQVERTRRKQFYRRLGWREVDGLSYIMPPVSSTPPPEMNLLVYNRELPTTLAKDRLRRWLEQIYDEVYGQSNDDPRIGAMIGALPARERLI